MTAHQYLQQNQLGFEGDTFAKAKISQIIAENKIDVVIETGTYLGATTKHFAEWVNEVYTVEINKEHFAKAKQNLHRHKNITQYFGNSAEKLWTILMNIKSVRVFMFLDAHWEAYNPLLDELEVIAELGYQPWLCVHDFKVPGRDDLGFDTYGDIVYEWDWIKPSIEKIYGKDYRIEYNSQATGAKRGIIFIYPV